MLTNCNKLYNSITYHQFNDITATIISVITNRCSDLITKFYLLSPNPHVQRPRTCDLFLFSLSQNS